MRLALTATMLVVLGLVSKLYAGPAAPWVHAYIGGIVYVMFWSLLALAIAPGLRVRRTVVTVLAITIMLECLQLWHPPVLQSMRATFVGHALLGSTFDPGDFVAYILGAWLALVCADKITANPGSRKRNRHQSD